jgi:hypothetical protein
MTRDADCDGSGQRAGVWAVLRCGRGDALDRDYRKLIGVEQRRAQHIVQSSRFGVVGNVAGEIGSLFAARLGVVNHEAGDRHIQPQHGIAGHVRQADRTVNCVIDDDVVVSEARQRTGSVHEDSQLGLVFIDMINDAGRQTRPRNGFFGARRGGVTGLEHAARGQQQRKCTDTQTFEHEQRSAVLLDYVECSLHAEPAYANSKFTHALRGGRPSISLADRRVDRDPIRTCQYGRGSADWRA